MNMDAPAPATFRGDCQRLRCPHASDAPTSYTVATLLARRRGIPVMEMTTRLIDVIDTEALDDLFDPTIGSKNRVPSRVEFELPDAVVVVTDAYVEIDERSD